MSNDDIGYHYCACRDCFEIICGHAGTLCDDCELAQCDPDQECQSPYGGDYLLEELEVS